MRFKLNRLRLTFKHMTIEGNKVSAWNVWRDRKHIAGGMCANDEDSRNDANIWMRDNLQFGDRVIFKREGRQPEEVRIEVNLMDTRNCCFFGRVIIRHVYRAGKKQRGKAKLGPMRHAVDPDELHLP